MTGVPDEDWRHWPSTAGRGAATPPPLSPVGEAPELDTASLVHTAALSIGIWDLPPGIDKTAGLRDGAETPAVTLSNVWRHPHAHPAVFMLLLLDRYGPEYLEWDPDTLGTTLNRDGFALSAAVWTKILAGRVVLNSPSPWRQWDVFHWTCLGLAGRAPNFTYLEEPEIGHLVAGFDTMQTVDPKRITGEAVDKYVAAAFKADGHAFIPRPLDWARRELENPQIRCRACGNQGRDDNDTKCVACSSPDLERLPFEFAALRDETSKLWEERRKKPIVEAVTGLPDTSAGNAVYHLLVHWDYANKARAQFRQQFRLLGAKT